MISSCIVGNDYKRVKEDSSNRSDFDFEILRREIHDLQFIVDHLKDDVQCTLEGSKGSLKRIIEREIGVLVYGVLEESVRKEVQFTELIKSLQKENEILIENEGGMMDELARLTLENEYLKSLKSSILTEELKDTSEDTISKPIPEKTSVQVIEDVETKEVVQTEVIDEVKEDVSLRVESHIITCINQLEASIYDDEQSQFLERIKRKLLESKMLCESLKIELEESRNFEMVQGQQKENELLELRNQIEQLQYELQSFKDKNKELETEICAKTENIETIQKDHEKQIRELMTINCELMDLSESGKIKEQELESKISMLQDENSKTKEEFETLKKVLTAQKIELERSKELLNRERKLSSLKISDLQDQIDELKFREHQ